MPTATEFRVRYAETDKMGVVYYANYLVWCEIGRTDFIRTHGMNYADWERHGVALAVSEAKVKYRVSATYDDLIRIETYLTAVKSRSLAFDYLIFNADTGQRLATAHTSLVAISPAGKPVTIPADIRAMLDESLEPPVH